MRSANPAARGVTKAERLTRHCIYMIATGKWRPGERLPSIRTLRREWGLNQEAVQGAYSRLIETGLVESRARSGYFVRDGTSLDRISQHRRDLASLHDQISDLIRTNSDLSVLGVLRYLARLEEIERQQEPDVMFVECTSPQAEGHATEIRERLQIPVRASTTTALREKSRAMMGAVRTIVTSSFHFEEVRSSPACRDLRVLSVPIEVSPEIRERLGDTERDLILLESDDTMASHIAEDAANLLGSEPDVEIVADPATALETLLAKEGNEELRVLLSPRLWGALDPRLQQDRRALQVSFRIVDSAWNRITEECGLPF